MATWTSTGKTAPGPSTGKPWTPPPTCNQAPRRRPPLAGGGRRRHSRRRRGPGPDIHRGTRQKMPSSLVLEAVEDQVDGEVEAVVASSCGELRRIALGLGKRVRQLCESAQ